MLYYHKYFILVLAHYSLLFKLVIFNSFIGFGCKLTNLI